MDIGGIGIETSINITVKNIEETAAEAMSPVLTRLQIEWEATTAPQLFPLMRA